MPTYYTYFICSLPMLHFGMKPPFSFERFLNNCQGFIAEDDILLLMNLPLTIDDYGKNVRHPTVEKWLAFDTALRNELVKIRAHSKKIDVAKYVRGENPIDMAISHVAMSSHRSTSVLEAEKILDEARWQTLDELGFGHYFDTGFLILYAYKLKMLERWEKINTQDKEELLAAFTPTPIACLV